MKNEKSELHFGAKGFNEFTLRDLNSNATVDLSEKLKPFFRCAKVLSLFTMQHLALELRPQ
jgi:hypothetical protein